MKLAYHAVQDVQVDVRVTKNLDILLTVDGDTLNEQEFSDAYEFVNSDIAMEYKALKHIVSYFKHEKFKSEPCVFDGAFTDVDETLYGHIIHYGNLFLKHFNMFGEYVIEWDGNLTSCYDYLEDFPIMLMTIAQYKEHLEDVQEAYCEEYDAIMCNRATALDHARIELVKDLRNRDILSENDVICYKHLQYTTFLTELQVSFECRYRFSNK